MSAFRLLAVGTEEKYHAAFASAAGPVLRKMAAENGFSVDVTNDTTTVSDENLANYEAFLMLQLAPFDLEPNQQAALQRFVESGKGWAGAK
ncbi:hypothetical protein BH11ARM2_BH11ARM2_35110 [soil metagenome]